MLFFFFLPLLHLLEFSSDIVLLSSFIACKKQTSHTLFLGLTMICFMSDFWLSDLKLLKGTFFIYFCFIKSSHFFFDCWAFTTP